MPASDPVKLFLNTQAGAPLASGIDNTVGELITLLDACLVDGYGSKTLSSLVVSGGVATATVSTGHGFPNIGTYGPVVRIEGATPSALNGDVRITSISATQFTFPTAAADGTATGTITAKRAPLGWTKEFSGTNIAVYRPKGGLRHYLRVDDTVGALARVRGFGAMSDINTGTDPYPTDAQVSGGLYYHKSVSTIPRSWILVGDDRRIMLLTDASGSNNYYGFLSFGNYINALPADAWCSSIQSATGTATSISFASFGTTTSSAPEWLARGISQTGSCVAGSRMRAGKNAEYPGAGGEPSPPACGFRRLHQAEVWEGTAVFRGWYPGVYCQSHNLSLGQVLEGFDGELQGRTLYTLKQHTNTWLMDITGPWFDE